MNMNKLAELARESSLARFLIPVGMILIVFGVITSGFAVDTDGYRKTEAVVSRTELVEPESNDGDVHTDALYDVYVKYTVDGKEYEEEFGLFPGYSEGDEVTISYDPADPAAIAQPGSLALSPVIFIAAGVVMLAGGAVSIVKVVQKQKRMKQQEEEWSHGS